MGRQGDEENNLEMLQGGEVFEKFKAFVGESEGRCLSTGQGGK